MPELSLRRFRPVLDLGEQFRLDPDALVRHPLCEGMRLADERLGRFRMSAAGTLLKPWAILRTLVTEAGAS